MTGSISMNSELNKIDNVINNRVSCLCRKYVFSTSIYPIVDPRGRNMCVNVVLKREI